jgi:hypothetical protein
MSATVHPGLAWFPLVPRPRPPGLPLEARVAELAALVASVKQGTRQERVTRGRGPQQGRAHRVGL